MKVLANHYAWIVVWTRKTFQANVSLFEAKGMLQLESWLVDPDLPKTKGVGRVAMHDAAGSHTTVVPQFLTGIIPNSTKAGADTVVGIYPVSGDLEEAQKWLDSSEIGKLAKHEALNFALVGSLIEIE